MKAIVVNLSPLQRFQLPFELRDLARASVLMMAVGGVALMASVPSDLCAQEASQTEKKAEGKDSGDQSAGAAEKKETSTDEKKQEKKKPATKWIPLTGKWKACQFGGDGKIEIKKDLIKIGYGSPISGVVWTGKVGEKDGIPRDNYEIECEARRIDGHDFLCALTIPIAKSHISLVMGGWGGGITGISSIDGFDASDNQTTTYDDYENGKWYKARVRVETTRIVVWVNEQMMFEHPREGHSFDIRFEMDLCTPIGLANYECDSEIRNVRIRKLAESEIVKAEKKK